MLWVCNTVGRVMDAAQRAADLAPMLYHSRFKYEDRVARHQAVIQAFRRAGPVLAICSQVAEMSLDLSADLLVTDLAPVPAMIQRLGRLNRRAKEGDPTKPFVVVEPDNPLPYTAGDLKLAQQWLSRLADDGVSQRELSQAWEKTAEEPPTAVASAWLDGGPCTTVSELRESSPGITVLMEEDVPRVKSRPEGPAASCVAHAATASGLSVAAMAASARAAGCPNRFDQLRCSARCPMAKEVKVRTAPDQLTMRLFAPGMSALHRAGLGGLACTLKAMERQYENGLLAEIQTAGAFC